jgi:membrane protease subunit (stomatin/prohibitin family)
MKRKLLSVARKLEKASRAHAGQAKTLRGLARGTKKKRK